MCEGEGKEYNSTESLDKESLSNLNNLEKTLNNKSYIRGNIISTDDIDELDELYSLNINITKNNYPNIFKWKKEIERIKLNWKISRKPPSVKGKTFKQYIQNQTEKETVKNKQYNEQTKKDTKYMVFHDNSLNQEDFDESQYYIIKILIKFNPGINLIYKDLTPKILIICHNNFVNKTDIREYIDRNDSKCINFVVTGLVNNEDYNIEKLSEELKRNISGVKSISILSPKENEYQ
jgi:hypothetical protein